jgi:23S rRNA pseudouridine1911/1915/1917 synthase
MNYYIVEQAKNGERLDRFLVEKTKKTRSQLKKAILNGSILVNEETAKVHQFLKFKDKITVTDAEITPTFVKEKPKSVRKTTLEKHQLPKVIEKTKDYIIIEKPARLLVHATKTSKDATLVDWLVKKFPKIKKITDPTSLLKRDMIYRPGIVHRLDKDVSGLMLICLNQDSFDYYKQQFKTRKVQKEYTALVHGHLSKKHDTIEFEISRKATGGMMAAHPKNSDKGKPSITEYNVEQEFIKATLVKIKLLTGRTNQIRVHFLALGHPLAGDTLYKLRQKQNLQPERLLLHASQLSFVDQQGENQTFNSELPDKFTETINNLK